MKIISVRDLQKRIRSVMETVAVETSRSFWKEIARRRKQETISLAEIRKRIGTK